jgi:tight adherence protein B
LWKDGQETTTTVMARKRLGLLDAIERAFQRAGWQVPTSTLLLSFVSAAIMLFLVLYLLSHNLLLAGGAVVILLIGLRIWVQRGITRRLNRLEGQLIDALELAARSLRAGHPLSGSFRLVSEEISPPVATIFAEICQRQSMGLPLEEALRDVALQSGSGDLNLFAASVVIQLRSGGNLADMMDRLACVIRDRRRLNGRVRVLTAQTQLSKRVLLIMPIAMFVLLNVLNPNYMEPLYTSFGGKIMLLVAASGMVLGAWVMNKLATLHY